MHSLLCQWLTYLSNERPGFVEWCSITEQSIQDNFSRVFGGYHAPIVAKLLYIYLSRGVDCVHIDFFRFATAFLPVMSDYSEVRGEIPFKLLDVDCDGKLSILNII